MKKIYIKTTEQCNLKCRHCYIGNNRLKPGFFNEDATISFLKKYEILFPRESFFVTFHGGEPFLAPLKKLEKVCNSFKSWNFTATTNLMNIDDDKIYFIKTYFKDENNKSFVKTSWDWKIRFSNDIQESIWKSNVKKLLNNNITVKVNICLTDLLIRECNPEYLINYLTDIGIREIHFERLSYNTTDDKTLIPDYDAQDKWLTSFYSLDSGQLKVDNFEELRYAANGCFIDCRKRECMYNTLTINADGTIGACPNTSIENWYMNIYNEPVKCINNKKHLSLISKEHIKNSLCYCCELYTVCNGDCCQLSWVNGKCPAPKRLIRTILKDVEKEKKNGLSI